jgi:hydroxymethylglutaryl-CoA reductase (NADPH)
VAQEEASLEVPVELFRGLYVPGSLKNTAEGFQFTLKNNILEAVVNSVDSIVVDGKAYTAEDISVKVGDKVRVCREVCAVDPFLLALDAEATFMVKGQSLSPGQRRLDIAFTAELVGKVQFDVTDTVE